jgi:hypothetical protein
MRSVTSSVGEHGGGGQLAAQALVLAEVASFSGVSRGTVASLAARPG